MFEDTLQAISTQWKASKQQRSTSSNILSPNLVRSGHVHEVTDDQIHNLVQKVRWWYTRAEVFSNNCVLVPITKTVRRVVFRDVNKWRYAIPRSVNEIMWHQSAWQASAYPSFKAMENHFDLEWEKGNHRIVLAAVVWHTASFPNKWHHKGNIRDPVLFLKTLDRREAHIASFSPICAAVKAYMGKQGGCILSGYFDFITRHRKNLAATACPIDHKINIINS